MSRAAIGARTILGLVAAATVSLSGCAALDEAASTSTMPAVSTAVVKTVESAPESPPRTSQSPLQASRGPATAPVQVTATVPATLGARPLPTTDSPPSPVAIRMTEEEVRAATLAQFDPEKSPEVHLVRLLPFGAIAPAASGERDDGPYWMYGSWGGAELNADHPVYIAVGSGGDIDLVSISLYQRDPLPTDDHRSPARRVVSVVVFDAVTGAEKAFGLQDAGFDFEPMEDAWTQRVAAFPTLAVDVQASARLRLTPVDTPTARPISTGITPTAPQATPTASPTVVLPPAGAVELEAATLSADQEAALEAFPLRVGARWVYRDVNRLDFRWETQRVTSEVAAAWRTEPGALVWRVLTEVEQVSPPTPSAVPGTTPAPAESWGVFARGESVIAYHAGTFYENNNREGVRAAEGGVPEIEALPPFAWWPLLRLPLEPGGPWFLGRSWTGDPPSIYAGFSVIGRTRVTVPAGSFDDCVVLRLPLGAAATATQWFCEGIGFVREEGYSNNADWSQSQIELVEFRPGR